MGHEHDRHPDNSVVENWGKPGMPPIFVRVLDRQVLEQSESGTFKREIVYIKGYHPHLGKLHNGWSGAETIVEREVFKPLLTVDAKETSRILKPIVVNPTGDPVGKLLPRIVKEQICPAAPWERDWIEFEEKHMRRGTNDVR